MKIEIDIKSSEDILQQIRKSVKNILINVTKDALDVELNKSLIQLKTDLLNVINEHVRYSQKDKDPESMGENIIDTPKSDADITKDLFGLDIKKVKLGSYSLDSYNNNVVYIQKFKSITSRDGRDNIHSRVEVPVSSGETLESIYNKALKHFQDSIYIDTRSSKPNYYILTESGKSFIEKFVKIFCSTKTGIQDKETIKRRKNESTKFDNFSRWALKQESLDKILNDTSGYATNVTSVIEDIKNGEFSRAEATVEAKITNKAEALKLKEKVSNLKKREKLSPETESYLDLVSLIKSLYFKKILGKNLVTYQLVGTLKSEELTKTEIFQNIAYETRMWAIVNQARWTNIIIKKIESLVDKVP